MRLNVFL